MTNFRTVASGIAVAAALMLQGCYTPQRRCPLLPGPCQRDSSSHGRRLVGAASDVSVRITSRRSRERDPAWRAGIVQGCDHGGAAGRPDDPGRILSDRRIGVPGREPEGSPDACLSAAHGALVRCAWRDVGIEVEQVLRVVLGLHLDQPIEVLAIGGARLDVGLRGIEVRVQSRPNRARILSRSAFARRCARRPASDPPTRRAPRNCGWHRARRRPSMRRGGAHSRLRAG